MQEWVRLDNLVSDGPVDRLPDLKAMLKPQAPDAIRLRQLAFFEGLPPAPLLKVTVRCRSVTPVQPEHSCPEGEPDLVRYDARPYTVRDRRIDNTPTFLRINRVRFRCRSCGQFSSERLPDVLTKHRMTKRLHRDLTIASLNRPFAEVAHRQGVKEKMVERIFGEYHRAMLTDFKFDLPEVLGIDDTKLLGAVRVVCSDVKEGKILDIGNKNGKTDVRKFLERHAGPARVSVIVMDMSTLYRGAIRDVFHHKPDIVADKFHVMQLATKAMDAARNHLFGGLDEKYQTALQQQARLFNKNRFKLSPDQQQLLKDIKGSNEHIAYAHRIKEEFARVFSYTNRQEAELAFDEWSNLLNTKKFSEAARWFKKLRTTVGKQWRTEVFNYWDHPYTSAFVERMNRNLKEMNRYASGMPFETLRAKAILKYGHFHTADEIELFDLMSIPPAKRDAALDYRHWMGFSPDTLARSLRAGQFEGLPPDLSQRPVVLPDGKNLAALEAEQDQIEAAWESGPAFPVVTPEMEAEHDARWVSNGWPWYAVSSSHSPGPLPSIHEVRRYIDRDYTPTVHFRGRARGHGRGRGISLNGPPEHERWRRKRRVRLSRPEKRESAFLLATVEMELEMERAEYEASHPPVGPEDFSDGDQPSAKHRTAS